MLALSVGLLLQFLSLPISCLLLTNIRAWDERATEMKKALTRAEKAVLQKFYKVIT